MCPEKIRLQQLYEAATRRWQQLDAPSQLYGQKTYFIEELKIRTLAERNAAKSRLVTHQLHCTRCRARKGCPVK
jgi:hypothetical protein